MNKSYRFFNLFVCFLISSCASFDVQYKDEEVIKKTISNKNIDKTFFLIGDAGNMNLGETSDALKALKKHTRSLNTAGDYTIFLGDNIYPSGMPKEKNDARSLAEHRIDAQVASIADFEGKTIFIPGNHDWYNDGLKGLKREEDYIKKVLRDKKAFQPAKGCPIKKIDVSDKVVILALDTQWYIVDWDKHPTINDNCEIKSRNDFFLEVEGELKKNSAKTILIAMHHPAYTNGSHGGYFNTNQHLFPFGSHVPLPGIGSLAVQIRAQGGVSPQDRFNFRYNELMERLVTLSKNNERVVFASGHEHSLQYIEHDGVKQIVSGSGSKKTPTALGNDGLFSYGGQGFAAFSVFADGSSDVSYFSAENGEPKLLYTTTVFDTPEPYDISVLPTSFEATREVSAYEKEATEKSKLYRWFWGEHYREIYGVDLIVPVVTLDKFRGGFTIDRKGGGHQSRALRLLDKDGKNFALRGVKKSAVRFLQSVVFTETYVEQDFKDTATEDVLFDFYTSSHPYATFAIGGLASAIGVNHTNPELVYVPKHKSLGDYNKEFGDELYVIEERPDDGFTDVSSFGNPDAIESTDDVIKKLRRDEKYQIDEAAYIKARLFDMLIGDWDRHQDQWRWSRFDISDDKKIYRPIPRDRDQAFSNYDGALLDFVKFLIPASRQFQEYKSELKNVKWINLAGVKMDRNFTQNSSKKVWLEQATFIQENLTDAAIKQAFSKLPIEVQNETAKSLTEKLKVRREKLAEVASRYYDYLTRLVIITGTDKDDYFKITRLDEITKISVSRIKGDKTLEPYKERTITSKESKEIWIYGMDDDDTFSVKGNGSKPIFTRIVGGQNNDVYDIEDGQALKVFDHKSKSNTVLKKGGARFRFTDIYNNNTYDFEKYISRVNTILPSIGFNPDDGMKLGVQDVYTVNGFNNDPHQQKHKFSAGYYFATNGFDLQYDGDFSNIFGKWHAIASVRFASENFTQNFFGFGNDTALDDSKDLDYNRVKTGMFGGRIGVAKIGYNGSRLTCLEE